MQNDTRWPIDLQQAVMLTTLPYYSFKSYFANTKLYITFIYNMLIALRYVYKKETTSMRLTIYLFDVTVIYVTLNVLQFNAEL